MKIKRVEENDRIGEFVNVLLRCDYEQKES